jgi:hypothetical protein
MFKSKSNVQPFREDISTDAVMRIFANLETLITAAYAANDPKLSKSLKNTLVSSLERYCDTQRAILEAKIKTSLKSAT